MRNYQQISLGETVNLNLEIGPCKEAKEEVSEATMSREYSRRQPLTQNTTSRSLQVRIAMVYNDIPSPVDYKPTVLDKILIRAVRKRSGASDATFYPNGKNSYDEINNEKLITVDDAEQGDTVAVTITYDNGADDSMQYIALAISGCMIGTAEAGEKDLSTGITTCNVRSEATKHCEYPGEEHRGAKQRAGKDARTEKSTYNVLRSEAMKHCENPGEEHRSNAINTSFFTTRFARRLFRSSLSLSCRRLGLLP